MGFLFRLAEKASSDRRLVESVSDLKHLHFILIEISETQGSEDSDVASVLNDEDGMLLASESLDRLREAAVNGDLVEVDESESKVRVIWDIGQGSLTLSRDGTIIYSEH
jgi:hypothetical protein